MVRFDCIERPLRRFFSRYGRFVARNPMAFIILPILVTAGCSVGLLKKNVVKDAIYLYTPTNAPSRYERKLCTTIIVVLIAGSIQILHDLFPSISGNYEPDKTITDSRQCSVIVTTIDGGNILDSKYSKVVEELNHLIITQVVYRAPDKIYTFRDLCMKTIANQCYDNSAIKFVDTLYDKLPGNLTFPTVYFGTKPVYLGSSLGGVVLKNGTNVVKSAAAWLLIYHLQYYPANTSEISGKWEKEFQTALASYRHPLVKVTYFHSQTLNDELERNADRIQPKFAITFGILVLFSVLCSLNFVPGMNVLDWVVSKPLLALIGVINAGMSVATAIGLLSLCNYVYNDIVAVMPFLVVSIGVDNMFLMLGAWRQTDRSYSVEQRLGDSLADSAISISITMLTDAFSFGVGTITDIPAVQIFCVYTCVAISFVLIYQLTFFLAFLALFGLLEENHRHCLLFNKVVPIQDHKTVAIGSRLFCLGTIVDPEKSPQDSNITRNHMDTFCRDWYAPVLMHPAAKTLVVVWFLIYLGFGLFGCTRIREGLRPENLLVSDSYAIPHYEALEKYFWNFGPQVQVLVQNSPDLSTVEGRQQAMNITGTFASTSHTIGADSVQFFLPAYLSYLETFGYAADVRRKPQLFYQILRRDYLTLSGFEHWKNDVVWAAGSPDRLQSYRFTVGMKNLRTSNEQRDAMQLLRGVAAKFPKENVSTFMYFWLFADQFRVVLPNTVQNVSIALGAMVIISVLLIPQPLCALWVAVAIASIDVGVVGYMTLWGVNLDAISMITIIMSIGFSVDFSAHICYGYVVSGESEPTERVRNALGTLAWPIIQGGLSTIIGVLTLADGEAYMIITFFKTVFLVIVIGLLHGLVFLPVFLSLVSTPKNCCGRKRQTTKPSKTAMDNSHSAKQVETIPRGGRIPTHYLVAYGAQMRWPQLQWPINTVSSGVAVRDPRRLSIVGPEHNFDPRCHTSAFR